MGTSDPQQKISYILNLLCISGAWDVFGEKSRNLKLLHVEFIQNNVPPPTSRKELVLGLKMFFWQRNDCLLHECHSICQVSKTKQVYVYMEVKTIDCSKQIWDLLTAICIYIYTYMVVLGLYGKF